MMLRAGWMGTDVKSALTSCDLMISSDLSWMPSRCCINSFCFVLGMGIFLPGVSGFWAIL